MAKEGQSASNLDDLTVAARQANVRALPQGATLPRERLGRL
jgi:hypothetical protein